MWALPTHLAGVVREAGSEKAARKVFALQPHYHRGQLHMHSWRNEKRVDLPGQGFYFLWDQVP